MAVRKDSNSKQDGPGVKRREGVGRFSLEGRKADLLASGFAHEAWFPSGRNSGGQLVRTKHTTIRPAQEAPHDGKVCCRHVRGERYELYIPYPLGEAENRREEHQRQCHENTIRLIVEERIAHIARALDEGRCDQLLAVAEDLLAGKVEEECAARPARLRLVVDNTRSVTG